MQKKLVMSVLSLLLVGVLFIGLGSGADFSRTWNCGGTYKLDVGQPTSPYDDTCQKLYAGEENCKINALPVLTEEQGASYKEGVSEATYSFDVSLAGKYSCNVTAIESGYGNHDGSLQTDENIEIFLNSISLGKTTDPYCNTNDECTDCRQYSSSLSKILDLEKQSNKLKIISGKSHGLLSLSISCTRSCIERTCSYYKALGRCGPSLEDNCGGTLSCYANCSSGWPCKTTADCQTGMNCSSGVCVRPKLNITYWARMDGTSIATANQGDTVLMIYGGAYLEGKTVLYVPQEYNSSFVWWSFPTWFSKSWNDAAKIAGNAYQPWTIPFGNTYKKRFGTLINLNGVDASDGQVWNHSGNLSINSYNNSRPIIGNVIPTDGIKVSVGTNVWFNQTTIDEDDLLRITWDFGDGTPDAIFQNYSSYVNSSSANVKHNYTQTGIYYWTLTAEEMNRDQKQKDSKERVIFVFEKGINVIPVITSPENGEAYGESFVDFNATQSFVANCSDEAMVGNYFTTYDGLLNCSYIHSPGQKNTNGYTLTANWTLDDDGGDAFRAGLWNVTNSDGRGYSDFSYLYRSSGVHYIKLRLTYED